MFKINIFSECDKCHDIKKKYIGLHFEKKIQSALMLSKFMICSLHAFYKPCKSRFVVSSLSTASNLSMYIFSIYGSNEHPLRLDSSF